MTFIMPRLEVKLNRIFCTSGTWVGNNDNLSFATI